MKNILQDFRRKDLMEQIQALEQAKSSQPSEILPELYELYLNPLEDNAVDYMVGMTLREILAAHENEAVAGLQHEQAEIQKLCIQICGQKKIQKSIPLLMKILASNSRLINELLLAMSQIQAPEFLGIFRQLIDFPDDVISATAIEMLSHYNDTESIARLIQIIQQGESDESYMVCDLKTGAAIETLGRLTAVQAHEFLASKLHYRNPAGRQLIHRVLIERGKEVLPLIAHVFEGKDVDMMIMAANVIGQIRDKSGGEILISAADRGLLKDPNVRYAVYEALGNIPFMKGIVFLLDGLGEKDPLLLTAVLTALENQINPGVIKKITETLHSGVAQARLVLEAIVTARAFAIFEALYPEPALAKALLECIAASKDPVLVAAFREKLKSMPHAGAAAAAEQLSAYSTAAPGRKILAADDSKAMLAFYRTALTGMGFEVTTALNGKEGLDLIKADDSFTMILTDMNMPIMDGIEFTRQARAQVHFQQIPIIMITTESDASQKRLAEKVGVNGFINKPFTAEQLKATIGRYITLDK